MNLNNLPMAIKGYLCPICDKWHKKPSKKFMAHYSAAQAKYGFRDSDSSNQSAPVRAKKESKI